MEFYLFKEEIRATGNIPREAKYASIYHIKKTQKNNIKMKKQFLKDFVPS